MTITPQTALIAGLGIYLTWRGDLSHIIWLSLATIDTFRALRTIHPNGRRVGIATRRRAMKDALMSWIVSAMISQFEPILSTLFGWLPFYTPLKWILSLGFFAVLKPASTALYTSLLAPFFKSYETPIDLLLLLLHSITAIIIHFTVNLPYQYIHTSYARLRRLISRERTTTMGDRSNPISVDDERDDGSNMISSGDISLSTPNIPGRLLRSTRKKTTLSKSTSKAPGEIGESFTSRLLDTGRARGSYGCKEVQMSPSLPPSPTRSLHMESREDAGSMRIGGEERRSGFGGNNAQAGPSRLSRRMDQTLQVDTESPITAIPSEPSTSREIIRQSIPNPTPLPTTDKITIRPTKPTPPQPMTQAGQKSLYPALPDQFIIPNPAGPTLSTRPTTRARPAVPARNPPVRPKPALQKSSTSARPLPTSISTSRLDRPISGSGVRVRLDPSQSKTSVPIPKRSTNSTSSSDSTHTERSVLSETERRDQNASRPNVADPRIEEGGEMAEKGRVDRGKGKAIAIGQKRPAPGGWESEVKEKRTRREGVIESTTRPRTEKVVMEPKGTREQRKLSTLGLGAESSGSKRDVTTGEGEKTERTVRRRIAR